jgi:PH (Pleckstrin Homology) domain-containing protein
MRFESKRDLWIVLLLRGVPVIVLAALGYAWYQSHHDLSGPVAGAVILLIAELFVFEWLMRSTYYVIEGDTLVIRSGFIRWRVPIREITSVTPTRNAVSSPALSLDRLRIAYGSSKWILVSPEEHERFLSALRSVNPLIRV